MTAALIIMDGPGSARPGASLAWRRLIARLYALSAGGMVLGLERVQRVLERLGHPERRFPAIHVVGSNGKGSTAAFTASILGASGRRVGLYTSPHLVSLTERVQVLDRTTQPEALSEDEVLGAFDVLEAVAPGFGDLSFFEAITAAGLLGLARRGVDVAVVEAGLGARLDATRLVNAEVAVLTELALEHTAILGSTLEEIAREKAFVIRPKRPLVAADAPLRAMAVIEAVAEEASAPIHRINRELHVHQRADGRFDLDLGDRRIQRAQLSLLGPHQGRNALLAARAATLFDPTISEAQVLRGLEETVWPGRMEILRAGPPTIVLDGAHNAQGVAALLAGLKAHRDRIPPPLHVVFGVLGDKDAAGMLAPMAEVAASLFLTRADTPRARPPEELVAILPEYLRERAIVVPYVARALELAEEGARASSGSVVVAGSLYLVGEARVKLGRS